eukprot:PhF_6_TR20792/c0_g1_i1/m.29854/K11290/SET, TAF1, I2PP2A; template-activating factor I
MFGRLIVATIVLAVVALAAEANANTDELQTLLKAAHASQDKVAHLNDQAHEQYTAIRAEYAKKYIPLYEERTAALGHVEGFWTKVLHAHPKSYEWFTSEDTNALKFLKNVEVLSLHDVHHATNYRINLTFAENPYFSDHFIFRDIPMTDEQLTQTGIHWKTGVSRDHFIFMRFFENTLDEEHTEAHLAHAIKHDLWPNPFTFYEETYSLEASKGFDGNNEFPKADWEQGEEFQ